MPTQAYFENIQGIIAKTLKQANQSILVSVAWFTDQRLFNALVQKAGYGVSVELIIFDDDINNNSAIDYQRLEEAGGKLYRINTEESKTLMHNKFCVIDFDTLINGSYNWTNKAKTNHENITITTGDPELANQFIQEFKRLKQQYFQEETDEEPFDLNKVIKRLSLIKTLVELEETEDIPLQIAKVRKLGNPNGIPELENIISCLQQRQYGEAVATIETFIKSRNQLKQYKDPAVQALKLEIKALETQLQAISDEKTAIEKQIFEFNVRHTHELGPILKKILAFQKENAANEEEREQARRDEEAYNKEYERDANITIRELNKEDQKELKKTFREASKKCHPDTVADKDKAKAAQAFNALKEAYDQNDLKKVKQIAEELKTGVAFVSSAEKIDQKEQLKALAENLRNKVDELLEEIEGIKASETYQTISDIADWDTYFAAKKEGLEHLLNQLKNE